MLTENLLESIRVVKENERKAADFYAEAALNTGNSTGRQLFEQLSEFEQYHYEHLTDLEKQLEANGDFIFYEGRDFPLPPEIVPKSVEEPNRQTVMEIISRALELEQQAEKAYADLAGQITDAQGHAMFQRLSEEEIAVGTASYPAGPAQIPAYGIIVPGSSEILASARLSCHYGHRTRLPIPLGASDNMWFLYSKLLNQL